MVRRGPEMETDAKRGIGSAGPRGHKSGSIKGTPDFGITHAEVELELLEEMPPSRRRSFIAKAMRARSALPYPGRGRGKRRLGRGRLRGV